METLKKIITFFIAIGCFASINCTAVHAFLVWGVLFCASYKILTVATLHCIRNCKVVENLISCCYLVVELVVKVVYNNTICIFGLSPFYIYPQNNRPISYIYFEIWTSRLTSRFRTSRGLCFKRLGLVEQLLVYIPG